MVKLEKVTFSYPGGKPIFDQFDWEIGRAQSWAVLGPSGCGKTTLLYLLAGLILPQSGSVIIDGQVLTRPRPQTGLILQDYGLLPWASVVQNVNLGLQVRDFYGPDGKHSPIVAIPSQPPEFLAAPSGYRGCGKSISWAIVRRSAPADGYRPHIGAAARPAADG